MPDQKGRYEILQVHAKNKKLAEDIDLKEIAMRTPGFTGADLANLLNEVGVWCCLDSDVCRVCNASDSVHGSSVAIDDVICLILSEADLGKSCC